MLATKAVLLNKKGYSGYPGMILDTNPLAYWPGNELSGTTIYDRSGNSFHGTYTGATIANTPAPGGGLAAYFDGINDRADMEQSRLQNALDHSEFTMMCWAKILNAATWLEGAYREVFHIRVDNNNRAYLIKPTTASTFQFIYNGGNSNTKLHQWGSMSSVTWMHMVLTISVSGNVMNSYIDNVKFNPGAVGITPWLGATPTIGLGCDGSASWWKGWIAHTTIWNRALNIDEVNKLYLGGL